MLESDRSQGRSFDDFPRKVARTETSTSRIGAPSPDI